MTESTKPQNIVDELLKQFPERIVPYLDLDTVAEMRTFASEDATLEVEGFMSERDFCRFICRQIIGMRQDLAKGDGETLLSRIMTCEEGAQQYLLLYGVGDE